MKIVIAEDNPTSRKLLQAQLEEQGHQVLAAADGAEALAFLKAEGAQAIISDILMPRMDGYRFCYEVRKDAQLCSLPFIFYTSTYTSPSDEKLARELGADDFVRKPASPQVILDALDRVLKAVCRCPRTGNVKLAELGLMKEYSERLVAKLEQKNLELERVNGELEAKEARLRLQRQALEAAANSIIITDEKGTICWVNRAFTKLTGYSAQEAIGMTPRILKSGQHTNEFYREFWTTIRSGKTWRGEFINRRKDGSIYYDEHTVTPVCDAQGSITHFVGVMHDMTVRKEAEEALKRRTAELESSNEELRRFNRASVGRELQMVELKREINELCQELGRPAPYKIAFAPEQTVESEPPTIPRDAPTGATSSR